MKRIVLLLLIMSTFVGVSCQPFSFKDHVYVSALTITSGPLNLGTNSIVMSGSLGSTGARLTKGWFSAIESTTIPTIGGRSLVSVVIDSVGEVGGSMVYPAAGIPLSGGSSWSSSITNNSANWNTAYSDRLKWDGNSTGLVAATGRASLGATTAGSNLFTLSNPSAISFLRINADNTVTALSAANFKTALSLSATDVGLGNVTNESKITMFSNPTFSGVQKVSTTDTLSTKAYARSVGGGNTGAIETMVDSLVTVLKDTVNLETIVHLQSDIVPQIVFGAGDGTRGSQVAFQVNKKLGAVWYGGSDTLHLYEVRGVVAQDSGTVTSGIQLYYDAYCFDGNPTAILNSTTNITSTTSGTVVTSFANGVIPPGKWIWGTVLTKSNGNMPVFMSITLSGYKQNRTN